MGRDLLDYYRVAKLLIEDQMVAAETLAGQLGYADVDVGKPYREMLQSLAEDCGVVEDDQDD